MRFIILIIVFLSSSGLLRAQKAIFSFEYHLGVAYNIPAPLIIHQTGEETLRFNAHFDSEPLQIPLYWQFRLARWKNVASWEFEAIHHKLYMIKNPDEIENFSISHGYNIISILRSQKMEIKDGFDFQLRYGIGAVLAHPENTIRGKKLSQEGGLLKSGYYISGPVLNVAVAKQFKLSERFYINSEFKFYPSLSKIPVVDGHSILWNVPVAFVVGLGIDFKKL